MSDRQSPNAMPEPSSRLSGFYQLPLKERVATVAQWAQLTQAEVGLLAQGMNPAQAATSQGFTTTSPYTWRDGDTLETVSQQFNTTADALLQFNPQMKTPQTGMVIEAPRTLYPNYDPNAPDWKPLIPLPVFDVLGPRVRGWQVSSPFWRNLFTSGPWKNAGGYDP